ncbi:hypothetical protein LTR28_007116 [Elasticomyces elasticus]|nr:hypothetical protein LTR28_007116 [Elasticomyces elasticus]
METIAETVTHHRPATEDTPTLLEEVVRWDEVLGSRETAEKPRTKILHGGRLVATYSLAEMGELNYKSDVVYQSMADTGDDYRQLDEHVLRQLCELAHKELDCHICYNLMLDPVTTACGHTFCRRCLVRVLDHSLHCPTCRRHVLVGPSLRTQVGNKTLIALLEGLCSETITARAIEVAQEEQGAMGELDTPLFPCTLGFPGMPTFLRIFEPRYRLMMRRALEGNGQFGMLMYNTHNTPQGDLGHVHFRQYGTILQIESIQIHPDGQSIVETRGLSRFKVKAHGLLDGYIVGDVERVEDISIAEEERLEVEETSQPPAEEGDVLGQLNRMSTRDLLLLGLRFIAHMQERSAPWLHRRILDMYGGPPEDAALFPYWFASILPIADDEKYVLLRTTSVRERLKITAQWIRRMEAQRW